MSDDQQLKIDPKTGLKERSVSVEAILSLKDVPSFGKPRGVDLFKRIEPICNYIKAQEEDELWLYNRRMLSGVDAELLGMDDYNNIIHGINFASADYMGLAQNQVAKEAAIQAARTFGVNSAGSPLAFGATKYFMQLKIQLAEFWQVKGLIIFSAGWLAGFGVFKALIKSPDYVIMDELCHNCLQEGAHASTKHVIRFPHLNYDAMVKILKETRQKQPGVAIIVVTEGLFSMDSDTPDLNKYQQISKQYDAYLVIDSAHDFGCMGENGRGNWEVQNLKDRSNVLLIGTGSKTLSTNIGFVGCENPKVTEYMKYYATSYVFTNAINPIQGATSLANLRILNSQLGKQLRKKVMQNYIYLRDKLESKGYKVFGNPCPILPLFVGNEIVCRLVARIMMDNGIHVNGIEYPVVKIGQARLRVNLMPQHTKTHLDTFVSVFEMSLAKSEKIFARQIKLVEKHESAQIKL